MEIFRDLYVSVDAERMAAIADLIDQSPPKGWVRDRAVESKARCAPVLTLRPTFCFTWSSRDSRPFATVILAQKDPTTFFVANVIPVAKHQLTHEEYNGVMEDFFERVVKPYVSQGGVTANLTGSKAELEHWMSAEAAERLRTFSACANKGTGASHPHDRERWNDFVLAAHRCAGKMPAADLRRWLIDIEEWSPEVADQLASEYEYGRELLAFAEARRSA